MNTWKYTVEDIPQDLAKHFIDRVYKATNMLAITQSFGMTLQRLMEIALKMESAGQIVDRIQWVNEHPLSTMYLVIMVDLNDGKIYHRMHNYMLISEAANQKL